MRWWELNDSQKALLTAWYLLADAERPSSTEHLPLEFSAALSELAAAAGKYKKTGRRFGRRRLERHILSNGSRQIRVRKQRHQLA